MANNPMEYLKQLEQMGEQMRQMFGNHDFMKQMMPNMPDFLNQAQGMGTPTSNMPGFDWMRGQYPRVDLYETLRDLVAVAELPGLQSTHDAKVSVEPQRLHLSGIIPPGNTNVQRDRMHVSERYQGAFEREIPLPIPVLPSEVRAIYRSGLLEIHMRKDQRNPENPRGQTVPISF